MAEPFNQLDDDDLYPTPTAPRASPTATVTGSPLVPPPEYGYTVSFNVGVGQPLPTMSLENADTDPIQRRNQHNITGNDESLHALPAYEGTGSSPVHLASSSSQSTRKRKISERAEEVDSSTPSKHQRTEYDTASESNARRVAERHSSSRPISPAERIPNVFTSHRKRQHSEGDNAIKTKHHRMTTRNDASSSRIPASPPIIAQSSLDRLQANDESFESIFNPTSANHQAQFRPSGPIRDSPQEVPRDPRLRSRGYLSGEGVSPDEISPPNHLTDLPDMENYRLDSPDLRCTAPPGKRKRQHLEESEQVLVEHTTSSSSARLATGEPRAKRQNNIPSSGPLLRLYSTSSPPRPAPGVRPRNLPPVPWQTDSGALKKELAADSEDASVGQIASGSSSRLARGKRKPRSSIHSSADVRGRERGLYSDSPRIPSAGPSQRRAKASRSNLKGSPAAVRNDRISDVSQISNIQEEHSARTRAGSRASSPGEKDYLPECQQDPRAGAGGRSKPPLRHPCPHARIVGCNKTFTRKSDANRHGETCELAHPEGGETHLCPRCDKTLSRADALKRHLKRCGQSSSSRQKSATNEKTGNRKGKNRNSKKDDEDDR